MNIDIIKKNILKFMGKKVKIKVNLGRNKYEYLEGKIDKMHNNIFTVNTNKGIRTYSYSDIATKMVLISLF